MWQSILHLLENPTSNATIIIVVLILVIIPNFPKIAQYVPFLKTMPKVDYEKIATNHMHQMPEVLSKLNIIEIGMNANTQTLDRHTEKLDIMGNRITRVETLLDVK